ncbi:MAG TPA: hypothetical protein VK050_05115 [Flavobacteriaceae bacterium]|nr:hypothetical protein [Flavobacteriaceae bacterium]
MKTPIIRFLFFLFGTTLFYLFVFYPESIEQPLQWSALWRSMVAILLVLAIGIYMGNKYKS